ncbi:MAG: MFS transporter [Spirochaetales bacterium]|nr:MFS transporter [Spirochaetales bacterium]
MTGIKGSPIQGLAGATLGFFIGFAAVSLFGPTVAYLEKSVGLTAGLAGLLIAVPNLSGSILRIPFSAMVDTTGGRRPFLILLSLSTAGILGIYLVLALGQASIEAIFPLLLIFGVLGGCGVATFSVGISQTSYWFSQSKQGTALGTYAGIGNLAPGLFAVLLSAVTIPRMGLPGSYLIWLGFLGLGTLAYALLGRNAWYFQLLHGGASPEAAMRTAREIHGQELFPKARARESLKVSARKWQTWALVGIYFTTFGGFIALTGWLPSYWASFHGVPLATAGALTALYSLLASVVRVAGGPIADRFGGERTALFAVGLTGAAAVVMTLAGALGPAVFAIVLMALGMGVSNAAVFKLVPQEVPEAIGGAAGWVGGLGAFGGFVIPNLMAYFVRTPGSRSGYARGFVIFVVLAAVSLILVLVMRHASAGRRRAHKEGDE